MTGPSDSTRTDAGTITVMVTFFADLRRFLPRGADGPQRYAGGRGLIAHYLLKYVPKGADPLGPDNILVIAPGVLTGAPVPGAGRHSVGAKSPLTGGFGESESGGYWGAELKRAGWDGIVFHGASPTPGYL